MRTAQLKVQFEVPDVFENEKIVFETLASMIAMATGMAEGVLTLSLEGSLLPKSEDNVQTSE